MSYLIAIDAGTTSVRSLAIDENSSIVDISQRELTQYFPRPGWVEHDPEEIWKSVSETLRDVCSKITEPIIGSVFTVSILLTLFTLEWLRIAPVSSLLSNFSQTFRRGFHRSDSK